MKFINNELKRKLRPEALCTCLQGELESELLAEPALPIAANQRQTQGKERQCLQLEDISIQLLNI